MLATRNPLQPGVYWIVLTRPGGFAGVDHDPTFRAWLSQAGFSVVLHARERDVQDGKYLVIFYTFEVTGAGVPPPFPFAELGAPTIVKLARAPGGVTDRDRATTWDDAKSKEQAPEPKSRAEELFRDVEEALAPTVEALMPWVVIGVALYLWAKSDGGNRHAVY